MGLNKGYLTAETTRESDEVFTPSYAVKPIVKYIEDYKRRNGMGKITIWCPFDKLTSNYVIELKKEGYNIIYSHIDDGKDFFEYEPEEYDIIVSNPPFSQKDNIVKRLYELDKPYAVLFPIPILQGQKRFPYIKDCQYLGFDKRINYYKDESMTSTQDGVSFGSCYLCRKFLPKDFIIEELIR